VQSLRRHEAAKPRELVAFLVLDMVEYGLLQCLQASGERGIIDTGIDEFGEGRLDLRLLDSHRTSIDDAVGDLVTQHRMDHDLLAGIVCVYEPIEYGEQSWPVAAAGRPEAVEHLPDLVVLTQQ
jgi:hypothetical protein